MTRAKLAHEKIKWTRVGYRQVRRWVCLQMFQYQVSKEPRTKREENQLSYEPSSTHLLVACFKGTEKIQFVVAFKGPTWLLVVARKPLALHVRHVACFPCPRTLVTCTPRYAAGIPLDRNCALVHNKSTRARGKSEPVRRK